MDLICENSIDPLDLEAFASGEPAPTPRQPTTSFVPGVPAASRPSGRWISGWPLPARTPVSGAGFRVERLRAFSRAEKRSLRSGGRRPPCSSGSFRRRTALLSVPMLSGPEQAGLLSALPAALGLEWKTLLGFPGIPARLPGSVSAIFNLLALQRGYAALSILLLLPAGFSTRGSGCAARRPDEVPAPFPPFFSSCLPCSPRPPRAGSRSSRSASRSRSSLRCRAGS